MRKKVILVNEQMLSEKKSALEAFQLSLTRVKVEYDQLGLRPIKTEDLPNLVKGEAFIDSVLLEDVELPKVSGAHISKEKQQKQMLEIIEKPSLRKFIESLNDLKESTQHPQHRIVSFQAKDFEVVNGKIVISAKAENETKESCITYAANEYEEKLYDAVKAVCDAMNRCNNEIERDMFNRITVSAHIIMIGYNGEFIPNAGEIKRRGQYH